MLLNYVQPDREKTHFTCPICGVLAEQKKQRNFLTEGQHCYSFSPVYQPGKSCYDLAVTTCQSCSGIHLWLGEKLIFPVVSSVQLPISEMPQEIKTIYDEARMVYPYSFKAAAALLRLALQHLCMHLGLPGKNINNDIKTLVERGLDPNIQMALDIIRVSGNEAVHPGMMDLGDSSETALSLFELLNFIVEQMISKPQKIEAMFSRLPEGAKKAIEQRDNK